MIDMNLSDNERLYEQGMTYYRDKAWMKAFDCFQKVETNIVNNIGEKLKEAGLMEAAKEYFKKVRKAENRIFSPTPPGSYFLRYLLIIVGIIALVCAICSFALFPSISFLFPILILLFDLLALLFILPFAVVKWATSRKRNPGVVLQQIHLIEDQMNQLAASQVPSNLQEFLKVEKLKLKRAQWAQVLARSGYTETELMKGAT
jgi:hypothetical protein